MEFKFSGLLRFPFVYRRTHPWLLEHNHKQIVPKSMNRIATAIATFQIGDLKSNQRMECNCKSRILAKPTSRTQETSFYRALDQTPSKSLPLPLYLGSKEQDKLDLYWRCSQPRGPGQAYPNGRDEGSLTERKTPRLIGSPVATVVNLD